MSEAKKLFIKTYGCQMNVYDSHKIADIMAIEGYESTNSPDEADMIVLNTCHIREKASEKLYSELGRLRRHTLANSAKGKKTIIAVAGCTAQAEGEGIFERAPMVDVVVGSHSYTHLPELVANAQRGHTRGMNLDFAMDAKFDNLPEESLPQGYSAFLSVQEGCDKFCHFCIVPYTRGAEFSRPVAAIYREAMALIQQGAQEITLLGQNVNAYHGEGPDGTEWNLGQLLQHIGRLNGLARLRYMTSHPRDMHDALYEAHATIPTVMPFLHLPVQSGSNQVLAAMNRKHTRDDYFRIIERMRKARPDIALSSDFIVGFPGETDADFADTLDLVREVQFAQAYSFKYSLRPGTPAAAREQIDESIKDERLAQLQSLLMRQQRHYNDQAIGRTMPVLIDRNGSKPGQIMGKTPYMQSVHLYAPAHYIGQIVDVSITGATASSLDGQLAKEHYHAA